MTPGVFCEAAAKAGLKTALRKYRTPAGISPDVLPVVLLLKDRGACLLYGCDARNGTAEIFDPAARRKTQVPLTELQEKITGQAIYIRPQETEPATEGARRCRRHWFGALIRENLGLYRNVLIAAALINLFALTSPVFIMNVYDRVIPNNALETGWVLGIGALTVYVFDFLIRTLRGRFIDIAARKTDILAARRIYDHLLNMRLADRPASSGSFASMLKDFDSVRDFLTSASVTAIVDLPFTLMFLAIIWLVGGPIALMLAGLILVVVLSGLALQIPLRAAVGQAAHASERRHGMLVETITGLETVKAAGADGRLRARYGEATAQQARCAQDSRFWSAMSGNIAAFCQQSATIITVLIGMYMVRDAALTTGGLIACVILGGRAIAPIGQIANLMTRYHQAVNAYRALDGFMHKPVERHETARFLHRPDLKGKIAFEKISFTYPQGGRPALEEISFTIEPGERVGIVGRSGSGKSTIARLMLGLYTPDRGAIRLDDTDDRQIDPADRRRTIGYIAQDVVLFSGTIRENIALGCPQAGEAEILRAAQAAGVETFVRHHPMGYDAPVGERGDRLSGGQKQAVALARAILTAPRVLVCDEPTNAMDVQAEHAFRAHIETEARTEGRSLILITHRQPLLDLVDRLILIGEGRILADGKKADVLEALSRNAAALRADGGMTA